MTHKHTPKANITKAQHELLGELGIITADDAKAYLTKIRQAKRACTKLRSSTENQQAHLRYCAEGELGHGLS